MPKQILKNELDVILGKIGQFPNGASLGEIMEGLDLPISRRNVQHRLGYLVNTGRLQVQGRARARRYFLSSKIHQNKDQKSEIPLSAAAEKTLKKVSQPIQARIPVGYHREFLDRYRPNQTQYLSFSVCQKLFELGKTDGERPTGTFARQVFNRLLNDLSWNSSRLEGNTYSLLETERLLKSNEVAEGKDPKEARM